MGQVKRLKSRGKTILLTTHYMEEAEQLADDLLIINSGAIVAQGTPAQLRRKISTKAEIRFSSSHPLETAELQDEIGEAVEVTERQARIQATEPQTTLLSILQYAKRKGISLEELTVQNLTLEDVCLKIIQSDDNGDQT